MRHAAERHRHAADTHQRAADLHKQAAAHYERQGDPQTAALERRRAAYQRIGHQIEQDHDELLEARATQTKQTPRPRAADPA